MKTPDGEYGIVDEPRFGYKRLDPVPRAEELSDFYQSHYYHLILKGGRAHELRRLMAGGEEARGERDWLKQTLHADVGFVLKEVAPGLEVLDIGSGTGEMLESLAEQGFRARGIEPSREAVAIASAKGLDVYEGTLESFVNEGGEPRFDAAVLINVLEHVPDPIAIVETIKQILKPSGIFCLRVPNDFNDLQAAAQESLQKDAWWIAAPDHINYFDFASLGRLLDGLGFEIVYSQSEFPMELFLLMGDDYIGNDEVGGLCHRKRVRFETGISADLRRRIYRSLARAGIGRDCLVFGRLKG